MSEPIAVRVRDCACPGSPHPEGDNVYLSPKLGVMGGITAERQLVASSQASAKDPAKAQENGETLERDWLVTFIRYGVTGWDFQTPDGTPLPLDIDVLLEDWSLSRPVADRASELYADTVMAPFLQKPAKPSRTGPTRATTSARPSPTTTSPSSP